MHKTAIFIALSLLCFVPLLHSKENTTMEQNPIVVIKTNQGEIEVELFADVAPKTCKNFLGLAEKKYYEGIIFHRIIKDFMIRGGDPTGTGMGGESIWGKPFEDEMSEDHGFETPGILAMANSGPNSNGSQFFITTAATPWLHMRHTVFGKVVSGMDIVAEIESSKVGAGDRPIEEQKIISVTLKAAKKAKS